MVTMDRSYGGSHGKFMVKHSICFFDLSKLVDKSDCVTESSMLSNCRVVVDFVDDKLV